MSSCSSYEMLKVSLFWLNDKFGTSLHDLLRACLLTVVWRIDLNTGEWSPLVISFLRRGCNLNVLVGFVRCIAHHLIVRIWQHKIAAMPADSTLPTEALAHSRSHCSVASIVHRLIKEAVLSGSKRAWASLLQLFGRVRYLLRLYILCSAVDKLLFHVLIVPRLRLTTMGQERRLLGVRLIPRAPIHVMQLCLCFSAIQLNHTRCVLLRHARLSLWHLTTILSSIHCSVLLRELLGENRCELVAL